MTNKTFEELGLSEAVLSAVSAMGFSTATPIQSEAIPPLLSGKDIIGQAQTGTGKTAAFGIPLLERMAPGAKGVQAIILCPTRELCLQVADEMKKLAAFRKDVQVLAIFGGDSYDRQIKGLKGGANVVVGTPGRVIDHIERKTLKLENVQIVVLDEADEMLNMGFREDMESILGETPEERQTVLFSATMSKEILALTKRFQRNAELIKVTREELTNSSTAQHYLDVKHGAKLEALCRLMDVQQLELALVFCNQKRTVDEVAEKLRERGYPAEALHGDLPQAARNVVMNRFRNGSLKLLIATDVAARGIDVDDVDAVINYDMPYDPEVYVHRIGRTGRAGRSGKAFSLVTGAERRRLSDISRYTKVEVERMPVPTFQDVVKMRRQQFTKRVMDTIEAGGLEPYEGLLPKLLENGHSTEQVVAALVKMNFGELKNEFVQENIDAAAERKAAPKREPFGKKADFKPAGKAKGGYAERNAPRGERFDKKSGKPYSSGRGSSMTRLVINIGKAEKISPSNIVGAIAGESGIPGSVLGQIDIYDRYTSVDVPATLVEEVLRGMSGAKIKGKKVRVSVEG